MSQEGRATTFSTVPSVFSPQAPSPVSYQVRSPLAGLPEDQVPELEPELEAAEVVAATAEEVVVSTGGV